MGVLFESIYLFIYDKAEERQNPKNTRKSASETENRRTTIPWDTQWCDFVRREQKWKKKTNNKTATTTSYKKKNAHKIQCLTESIIVVAHQLLFRFVMFAFVAKLFFLSLLFIVLFFLLISLAFVVVAAAAVFFSHLLFGALFICFYSVDDVKRLSHFLAVTLCRTHICHIHYVIFCLCCSWIYCYCLWLSRGRWMI